MAKFRFALLTSLLIGSLISAQGQDTQPQPPQERDQHPTEAIGMQGMQHTVKPLPPPQFPILGSEQQSADRPLLRLEELEALALKNNPTLAQATAEITSAKGRRLQSGLWPNPTAGYIGEEIRGGSFRGGQQGFFIEQEFLLGNKLSLNRKVLDHEVRQAELESEEQQLRVKNAVRLLYYQALAAQETLAMHKQLARISAQTVAFKRQLFNVGQQNETEVLESEIEAEQADLAVTAAEHARKRSMAILASVVGASSVQESTLAGSLEQDLPDLDEQQMVAVLLKESPAVRIAEASVAKAEAALLRARRESIPDLMFRGGLQQNRELQETTGQPVGLQGFAEVGVQLKLFNRNQGNVRAVEADVERARREVKRIELVLRERSAAFVDNYTTAQTMVDRYRTSILPKAQRAYELIYQRYGLMQASYPQVLNLEHTLYKLEAEYVTSLGELWSNAITLRAYLLTDGLEAPSRPSDVDRNIREINLPSSWTGGTSQER